MFQADALVCNAPRDLQLNKIALSEALLKAGGIGLQQQCHQEYPKGLEYGDVVMIDGHSLKCDNVYFTAIPKWDTPSTNPIKVGVFLAFRDSQVMVILI